VAEVSSAAVKAGIQPGDIVWRRTANNWGFPRGAPSLMKLIQEHANQQLPLTPAGQRNTVKVTPEPGTDGKGRIGVQLGPYGKVERRRAAG